MCLVVVGLRVAAVVEQTFYALQYAVAVQYVDVCYSQYVYDEQCQQQVVVPEKVWNGFSCHSAAYFLIDGSQTGVPSTISMASSGVEATLHILLCISPMKFVSTACSNCRMSGM